ncbi:MAG: hypothetical protein VXY83_01705 [Pseudomonadota bacterium]|nr:hypothetical protein [Pseudomonadota bacterium]MEC8467047.1 hypothetical protein [Pseudomonadota bacterium]|tara:strand:+ start:16524 stop:16694 length:171 start_codon:yes stop_codon:yes gene_type:complete
MKTFEKLNNKQKEKIITAFGTVVIVTLTVLSSLSFDMRNDNLVSAMNKKMELVNKG